MANLNLRYSYSPLFNLLLSIMAPVSASSAKGKSTNVDAPKRAEVDCVGHTRNSATAGPFGATDAIRPAEHRADPLRRSELLYLPLSSEAGVILAEFRAPPDRGAMFQCADAVGSGLLAVADRNDARGRAHDLGDLHQRAELEGCDAARGGEPVRALPQAGVDVCGDGQAVSWRGEGAARVRLDRLLDAGPVL